MLCLKRREGQKIILLCPTGEEVVIEAVKCRSDGCVIGFDAPESVQIHREEVQLAIEAEE